MSRARGNRRNAPRSGEPVTEPPTPEPDVSPTEPSAPAAPPPLPTAETPMPEAPPVVEVPTSGPTADDFVAPPLLPRADATVPAAPVATPPPPSSTPPPLLVPPVVANPEPAMQPNQPVAASEAAPSFGEVNPAIETEPAVADALADVTAPVATVVAAATPIDELLPPPEAREVARRKARFGRWGRMGAGVAGGLLLVALFVFMAMSGGDSPNSSGSDAQVRGKDRARTSPSSRPRRSGSSTTTTTTSDGAAVGSPTTASSSPGGANPGGSGANAGVTPGDPSADPNPAKVVTLAQSPGSWRYDPDSFDLFVDGTATNSGSQTVTAEFDISWVDDTGELDSWSDVLDIAPHSSEAWSETGSATDPPVGALRCVVTLVG